MDSPERPRCWPGQDERPRTNGWHKINSFALVAYVPGDLANFLDEFRCELVPDCVPRAHVTILPPRPVDSPLSALREHVQNYLHGYPAFRVETNDIEVFDNTSVVYIGLTRGHEEFTRMHDTFNSGPLQFEEPYGYHPHITVAQGLQPEQVPAIVEASRRRWAEYPGPRGFDVETITLVQNTLENRWLDLAEFRLGPVAVSR